MSANLQLCPQTQHTYTVNPQTQHIYTVNPHTQLTYTVNPQTLHRQYDASSLGHLSQDYL